MYPQVSCVASALHNPTYHLPSSFVSSTQLPFAHVHHAFTVQVLSGSCDWCLHRLLADVFRKVVFPLLDASIITSNTVFLCRFEGQLRLAHTQDGC
jgi:hypothetical protein